MYFIVYYYLILLFLWLVSGVRNYFEILRQKKFNQHLLCWIICYAPILVSYHLIRGTKKSISAELIQLSYLIFISFVPFILQRRNTGGRNTFIDMGTALVMGVPFISYFPFQTDGIRVFDVAYRYDWLILSPGPLFLYSVVPKEKVGWKKKPVSFRELASIFLLGTSFYFMAAISLGYYSFEPQQRSLINHFDFLVFIFHAAFLQEFYFRMYLQKTLESVFEEFHWLLPFLITNSFFSYAIYMLVGVKEILVLAFIMGGTAGILRKKSGSIISPWVFHLNILLLTYFFFYNVA